jgi:hypothetical protein
MLNILNMRMTWGMSYVADGACARTAEIMTAMCDALQLAPDS